MAATTSPGSSHEVGKYAGDSAQTVRDIFDAAGEEDGRAIVGGNAIDLWNLG